MLGERYVVEEGDNLWRIAARRLGDGREWPRIWRYNNRRQVVAVTGRAIPDPDRLQVKQILLLPILPNVTSRASRRDDPGPNGLPVAAAPVRPGPKPLPVPGSYVSKTPLLQERLKAMRSPIAFKFRLDDLPWRSQTAGTAPIDFKMTGDLVFMTKRAYPIVDITQRMQLEAQLVTSANQALGDFVKDIRVTYDPASKRIATLPKLVTKSRTPGAAAWAIVTEASGNQASSKRRAELRLPKLEGSVDIFNYVALDVKIVLEIKTKEQSPANNAGDTWASAANAKLETKAVCTVTATIIEDFLSGVIGVADDAASLGVASSATTRGIASMGASAFLPRAAQPATVYPTATLGLPS